jgi:hypothetical protein
MSLLLALMCIAPAACAEPPPADVEQAPEATEFGSATVLNEVEDIAPPVTVQRGLQVKRSNQATILAPVMNAKQQARFKAILLSHLC